MNFNLTGYELALIAGGFTVIGAMLGNWVSHRFSDYRDRRKERNEAADRLDSVLRKEREGPMPDTSIDFSEFIRVINGRELTRFDKCIEKYHQAKRNAEIVIPENNGPLIRISTGWYHDTNPIVSAIDNLREYTKRK